MKRLALLVAIVAAGCGSLDDNRPQTLQYIQAAIIEPTCAKAMCHAAFAQEDEYNFGTFRDTQVAMVFSLVTPDMDTGSVANAQNSFLITLLTVGQPSPTDKGTNIRMPYDEPMPTEDIDFLEQWIASSDELGLGAAGAQCVPNDQGVGCTAAATTGGKGPVPCSPEGNVLSLTPTTICTPGEQFCEIKSGTCVPLN